MQQTNKQKTSVFSEYQNNENDSISSRQLEFWLKQTAPIVQPKLGNEWTLMSANSIFQQDQHPLLRNQTYESLQKENDSLAFNSNRQIYNNSSSIIKSKSYVNAMTDLQTKLKKFQKENDSLKHGIKMLREEKNRSLSESTCLTEQLKNRIECLEPKTKRIEELVRENKQLKDWKEENMKRLKVYEKMQRQWQVNLGQMTRKAKKLEQAQSLKVKVYVQSQQKTRQLQIQLTRLKEQKLKLQQRLKKSQDLKQKSTTSILQKLSNLIKDNQILSHENILLKDQLSTTSLKSQQRLKQLQQKSNRQRQEYMMNHNILKHENMQKKQLISLLNEQNKYFKEAYNQINQEFIISLKKHSEDLKEVRGKEYQYKIDKEYQHKRHQQYQSKRDKQIQEYKRQKSREKEAQNINPNRQKLIQSNRYEIFHIKNEQVHKDIDINKVSFIQQNPKDQIESQFQFEEFNEQEEPQQPIIFETRSVIEKTKNKKSQIKQKNSNKSDIASQQNYKPTNSSEQKNTKRKLTSSIIKPKERSNERHRSNERPISKEHYESSKEKSKNKSKQKSKEERINQNQRENGYIAKSYEPLTHQQEPQYLYYTDQQRFNTTHNRKNIPYYWDANEIAEFSLSQRRNQSYTNRNNSLSVEKLLLNELSREAVRLLEQQEKIINSNSESMNPTERAEMYGRLKQLNEQIKVNNQKLIQTKQKLNNN